MCFIVEQCAGGNCPKTSEMKCGLERQVKMAHGCNR